MINKDKREILIAEYDHCEDSIEQNENAILTSATTFFTLSVAGIAYIASQSTYDVASFTFVFLVAIASISILWGWYKAFLRWKGFQHFQPSYYFGVFLEDSTQTFEVPC